MSADLQQTLNKGSGESCGEINRLFLLGGTYRNTCQLNVQDLGSEKVDGYCVQQKAESSGRFVNVPPNSDDDSRMFQLPSDES